MLFYGEEIGMGENLDVPGRLSVRTPMQWTPYDNGGFSTAPPERFVRPMPATATTASSGSASPPSAPTRTRCSTGWPP